MTLSEGVEYNQIAQAPIKITSGIFISQIIFYDGGNRSQISNFAPNDVTLVLPKVRDCLVGVSLRSPPGPHCAD